MAIVNRLRSPHKADEGSALVAAMGVALIGIMFSLVVVAVAIVVTRDAGRDRVRTSEIHAAESALDTTILALSTNSPCVVGPVTVGAGSNAVAVNVAIEYFDAGNLPLNTCVSGKIVGTPKWARITSVGTQVAQAPGIHPARTIQAKVNLVPHTAESSGSAIYSAGSFSTGGGFTMGAVDPSKKGRVWINSGDWLCNGSMTIDGDLVVANGGVTLGSQSCTVKGNVWAKTFFKANSVPTSTYSVWGNLTVHDGGMNLANPNRFGGKVSVRDAIVTSQPWKDSTVKGAVCSGSPGPACTSMEDFAPIPMPVVNYVPAEWGATFGQRTKTDLQNTIITSWKLAQQWEKDQVNNGNCFWPAGLNDNYAPKNTTLPVIIPKGTAPAVNALYDLRTCDWNSNGNLLTLSITSDIAIFAKSFAAENGIRFVSGDTLPHHVYFIVPVTGPSGYVSGKIYFTGNGLLVDAPLDIFVYTPNSLTFPVAANSRGQLYGGTVAVDGGGGTFLYAPVPAPSTWFSTASTAGYDVQIVNKNEN